MALPCPSGQLQRDLLVFPVGRQRLRLEPEHLLVADIDPAHDLGEFLRILSLEIPAARLFCKVAEEVWTGFWICVRSLARFRSPAVSAETSEQQNARFFMAPIEGLHSAIFRNLALHLRVLL